MKDDLNLFERLNHGLCNAVEMSGAICFNHRSRGKYCAKHLSRLYKYQSFDLPPKKVKKCKFIDCNEIHNSKRVLRQAL